MSNVVQLHAEPREGENAFMLCPCTEEGVPYVAMSVVIDQPFIAALVCPECEQEAPVINGYLDTGDADA